MVGLDRETLNGGGCLGQRRCEKTRLENCWSGALKEPEVGLAFSCVAAVAETWANVGESEREKADEDGQEEEEEEGENK